MTPANPCSWPYVFVVGCPRSGTTLLQRMLDAHPDLAIANDSHFIPRAVDKVGLEDARRLQQAHVDFVRTYKRTKRLKLPAEDFEPEEDVTTYPDYVGQIYRRFAAANGKRLAGEKTPDYVKRIDMLHSLFPKAKFLHIIRDGREVVQSILEWSNDRKGPAKMPIWHENPFAVACLWWADQVRRGITAGRKLGGLYMEVHYRDLTSDPGTQLSRIARFLDLPDSEAMFAFHEGKEIDNPKLSAKSAWRPVMTGLRDARALDPKHLMLFDVLCGDVLEELRLPRSSTPPDPKVLGEAVRIRDLWEARSQTPSRADRQRLVKALSVGRG